MTCPKCNVPIDEAVQSCQKCGATLGASSGVTKRGNNEHRKRRKIFFWVSLNLALVWLIIGALFPSMEDPIIMSQLSAVAMRGKDIYVAISDANIDREPLGLPSVLPKTYQAYTNELDDIAFKRFKTSSDYFYELYDGANMGTSNHDPYVRGFDYSKLAGGGVPAKYGQGRLCSTNNMWIIAANITDQDDERIPVLLTRNVDIKEIERVANQGLKASEFKKRVAFGRGLYNTPFGKEGFVGVRNGGDTINICRLFVIARTDRFGTHFLPSQAITLGELFGNKELPPRDPSKPPIVYLMP